MVTQYKVGGAYNSPIEKYIVDSYSELTSGNFQTHTMALVLVDESYQNKSTVRVKNGSGNWVIVPEYIFKDF